MTETVADSVLVPNVTVAVCVGDIVPEIDVVSVAVLRNSLMERESDCDWGFCVSDTVESTDDDLLRVTAVWVKDAVSVVVSDALSDSVPVPVRAAGLTVTDTEWLTTSVPESDILPRNGETVDDPVAEPWSLVRESVPVAESLGDVDKLLVGESSSSEMEMDFRRVLESALVSVRFRSNEGVNATESVSVSVGDPTVSVQDRVRSSLSDTVKVCVGVGESVTDKKPVTERVNVPSVLEPDAVAWLVGERDKVTVRDP